jgi:aspartate/methionine/tyrosine aminotransferase
LRVSRERAARRVRGFGTSIFTEMSALAAQHGAVNLGQGFPDFPAPEFIKDAAARAIAADRNQYAPAAGLPRLRSAIADRFAARHGHRPDPDSEISIAAGATEILFDAVMALVDPGDEVMVFEPHYDSYVPAIRMAGAEPRVVTLRPPHWTFEPAELAAAFTPRTRLVMLNTPHNPTGKVWSTDELDEVARLCVKHDVVAISDEVYSEITYAGSAHVPLATRPGMAERTVTVDSIGKTFSVTGWKIGWAIAAAPLTDALRAVHQFVTFANATPLQVAAADALEHAARHGYFDELRSEYTARRARLADLLERAGLRTLPVGGAYFLLADLAGRGFADDVAFCRYLVTQVGVAAIPPSAFYGDPTTAPLYARFCFAKREATFAAAEARLTALGSPRQRV